MRALAVVLVALAGCTASSVSHRHNLIPADADFVFGVDIAAVLTADGFHEKAPEYADSIPFVWLAAARTCGIDPIQSHLSLLGGTDHKGQLALMFTGLDIGDAAKLRCISDRLTAPNAGPASFSIHDRDHAGSIADRDRVATIVDSQTVVFATRDWAEMVHLLIHGTGSPHPARPPADRRSHAWLGGRPFKRMPSLLGEAQQIYATFDMTTDLRIDLSVVHDAEHLTIIHENNLDTTFQSNLKYFGVFCWQMDRQGDGLRLDLEMTLEDFVRRAPNLFTDVLPPPFHFGGTC